MAPVAAGVGAQSHRHKWELLYKHILKQLQRFEPQPFLQSKARQQRKRPDQEVADIPCKAVYQWPVGRTLGAAQHA